MYKIYRTTMKEIDICTKNIMPSYSKNLANCETD